MKTSQISKATMMLYLAHGIPSPFITYQNFLVYRGTTSVKDVLSDVDARTEEFHGIRLHKGLLRMYKDISATEKWQEVDKTTTGLFVGGYSCGGVMALMHAIDRAVQERPIDQVITIANPRFVHRDSLQTVKRLLKSTQVVRIMNPNDVVTLMPPFFEHVSDNIVSVQPRENGGWLKQHMTETYATALEENRFIHDLCEITGMDSQEEPERK